MTRGTLPDRAADRIRGRIQRGEVRLGERLEPMRVMARDLGVSLSTVREAIARLKAEGMVDVRHGTGVYVARRPSAARGLKASRLRASRQDAAELLAALEPAAARMAARKATARNIEELHTAFWHRRLAQSGRGLAEFTRADLDFHRAVAQAAGNGVAIGMQRMASTLLRPSLRERAEDLALDHRLDALHAKVMDAIDRGHALKAERAARAIAAIEAMPP